MTTPPITALAKAHSNAPTPAQQQAQAVVMEMLAASVDAFGDVVRALLCDLAQASEGMAQIGWLGPTPQMLDHEQAYRVAVEQLQWWEHFLSPLVHPRLRSEEQIPARRQARAERARAILMGQQRALDAHREAAMRALQDPRLTAEQKNALLVISDQPEQTQWLVNPQDYIHQALAQLPPLPPLIPIVQADLDPSHNFSGARAVSQLRSHAQLAPRAAALDQALAALLQEHLRLPTPLATQHAQVLTGMFWLALRRALARGHHNLAASVALLSGSDEEPIREQFTRELLMSWFSHLQNLPAHTDRPSLFQRIQRALGMGKTSPPSPKQLTDHQS